MPTESQDIESTRLSRNSRHLSTANRGHELIESRCGTLFLGFEEPRVIVSALVVDEQALEQGFHLVVERPSRSRV